MCTFGFKSQNISENFDSYIVGSHHETKSKGLLTSWSNNPRGVEGELISSYFSFSGVTSAELETTGVMDVVLKSGGQAFGRLNLSLKENRSEMILFPSQAISNTSILCSQFRGSNYKVFPLLGEIISLPPFTSKTEVISCGVKYPGDYYVKPTNSGGLVYCKNF